MKNVPVFLQAGFRTGGTWLWSRFRESPEVLALCEPLNELLESVTLDGIRALTSSDGNLNHPEMSVPYFHEYSGLLTEGMAGVPYYRSEFGIQTYFDPPDEQPHGLADYLSELLAYADHCKKQPVLKFTRALGRASWLKTTFPAAIQILLLRDPWSQFQSGWGLACRKQNFTFLMIPLFALSRARTGPLQVLCHELGIPHIPFSEGIANCAGAYTELARQLSPAVLFGAFLGMFIASHFSSVPFADLVIDYGTFAQDILYREEIERSICNLTGLRVNLSNYQASQAAPALVIAKQNAEEISNLVYSILENDYTTSVDFARKLLSRRAQSMLG